MLWARLSPAPCPCPALATRPSAPRSEALAPRSPGPSVPLVRSSEAGDGVTLRRGLQPPPTRSAHTPQRYLLLSLLGFHLSRGTMGTTPPTVRAPWAPPAEARTCLWSRGTGLSFPSPVVFEADNSSRCCARHLGLPVDPRGKRREGGAGAAGRSAAPGISQPRLPHAPPSRPGSPSASGH